MSVFKKKETSSPPKAWNLMLHLRPRTRLPLSEVSAGTEPSFIAP